MSHLRNFLTLFLYECTKSRFLELRNGTVASGVPRTTPFIHRDTNFFLLEDLDPATEYQVDVYLIPVPRAKVEMVSDSVVTFSTLPPKLGENALFRFKNYFQNILME